MSIESGMSSNNLIFWCPLLLLPSIFPSIRVFSNDLALCIRWSKYWSFRFSISPSNEYSGLISFRIDWFDLLAVWRTLKNLLQNHSLKTSILWLGFIYGPTLISVHDYWKNHQFSLVQSLSHVWLFATSWTAACQASLSITNSWSLPKLTSIESVMLSSHLILCRPLLLLPPIPPSIRVFSNESTLRMRWPKEFQLQHQSFHWTPRTDLL